MELEFGENYTRRAWILGEILCAPMLHRGLASLQYESIQKYVVLCKLHGNSMYKYKIHAEIKLSN